MDKYYYDKKIEVILTELRNSLFDIVKSHGPIDLFEPNKHRLEIGSFKEVVASELYIENNKLMLKCSYYIDYDIVLDCDFKIQHTNIGNITYTDYLNLYRLVVEIINE